MITTLKRVIRLALKRRGIILMRPPAGIVHGDPNHIGAIPFSKKLAIMEFFYRQIKDVDGDIVESGIWWGYGILTHLHLMGLGRTIYAFDSFAGHSKLNKMDKVGKKFANPGSSWAISEEDVWKTLEMGTEMDRSTLKNLVKIIPGWMQETMPAFRKEHRNKKIALVHCDPDLYEPVFCTLSNTWDLVQKSGVVIIGRLNNPEFMGKTYAVNEFLKTIPAASYTLHTRNVIEFATNKTADLNYLVKNF